jgi:hypothetical protein
MPLKLGKRSVALVDHVTIDEVEPLAQWLRDVAQPSVNLRACTHLHTAALQALLAARVRVSAAPADPFLAEWVAPLLANPAATPHDPTETP